MALDPLPDHGQDLLLAALMAIARDLHLADVASLYAAVGDSQVSAQSVVQKLMAAYGGEEGAAENIAETAVATRPPRSRQSSSDPGVVVRGVSDVWIKLARRHPKLIKTR